MADADQKRGGNHDGEGLGDGGGVFLDLGVDRPVQAQHASHPRDEPSLPTQQLRQQSVLLGILGNRHAEILAQ